VSHWGADGRQFCYHLNNIYRLQTLRPEAVAGRSQRRRYRPSRKNRDFARQRFSPQQARRRCANARRGAAEHSEPDLHCVAALDERRDQDEPPDAGEMQQARHRLSVLTPLVGARACAARQSSQSGMDILGRSWRTYPKLTDVKAPIAQVCQDPLA
jgi:hypothetical protein